MSGADDDKEYIEDDDFAAGEDSGDNDAMDITQKIQLNRGRSDALRRIEEYRRLKELRSQVEFFDGEVDGGEDYLSEI